MATQAPISGTPSCDANAKATPITPGTTGSAHTAVRAHIRGESDAAGGTRRSRTAIAEDATRPNARNRAENIVDVQQAVAEDHEVGVRPVDHRGARERQQERAEDEPSRHGPTGEPRPRHDEGAGPEDGRGQTREDHQRDRPRQGDLAHDVAVLGHHPTNLGGGEGRDAHHDTAADASDERAGDARAHHDDRRLPQARGHRVPEGARGNDGGRGDAHGPIARAHPAPARGGGHPRSRGCRHLDRMSAVEAPRARRGRRSGPRDRGPPA